MLLQKPAAMRFYEANMRCCARHNFSALAEWSVQACVIHEPNRVILQYADRYLIFRDLDGIAGRLWRHDNRIGMRAKLDRRNDSRAVGNLVCRSTRHELRNYVAVEIRAFCSRRVVGARRRS
jgi:hypothetical protein